MPDTPGFSFNGEEWEAKGQTYETLPIGRSLALTRVAFAEKLILFAANRCCAHEGRDSSLLLVFADMKSVSEGA